MVVWATIQREDRLAVRLGKLSARGAEVSNSALYRGRGSTGFITSERT
jgi:hypothetical protein